MKFNKDMQGKSSLERVTSNKYQKHFYEVSSKFVDDYKDLLSRGKILVVGHGLGYQAYLINEINQNVEALDIEMDERAVLKEKVTLYKGARMPFKDNEFDVVICAHVLHHTRSPEKLFGEIVRVSKGKIIIVEELYSNILGKMISILNCFKKNKLAKQKTKIYWGSIFSKDAFKGLIKKYKLEVKEEKERKKLYFSAFTYILEKS